MTTTPDDRARLDQLGDALRSAAADDLARSQPAAMHVAPRRRTRRTTLLAAAAVALIAVPGAAIAGNALIGEDEVARSIPNGTLALLGTDPTCTTVREGVEFDCVLSRAPQGDMAPGEWMDAAEPTVGDDKHVNGGCRSRNAEGTRWSCYVGREAVRQEIIGPDFLGEYAPVPGVG